MPQSDTIQLSICIATFNRARCIGETLDSLISQLGEGTELIILDGGSTDATETIVAGYAARCARLRYFRQDTNNGVDRDFDRAVQLARGEYCWLMSDDDLIKPGAIGAVLAKLELKLSVYIVNAEVRSHDFATLLESRRLKVDADRLYTPAQLDLLFIESGLYVTFIGCVVIERALWMARQREPYFGSQFIHMGVIFQEALPRGAQVIAAVLITIRYGNASWKSREFEIWMLKWPTLVWSLPALSEAAKSAVCPPESWSQPKTLLLYRAKGAYSMREYRSWVGPRVTSALKALAARLIAVFPASLANLLAVFYFSRIRPHGDLTLADLKNSRFYFRNWRRKG